MPDGAEKVEENSSEEESVLENKKTNFIRKLDGSLASLGPEDMDPADVRTKDHANKVHFGCKI